MIRLTVRVDLFSDEDFEATITLTNEQYDDIIQKIKNREEEIILPTMLWDLNNHIRVQHYGEDFRKVHGYPEEVILKEEEGE